MLDQPYRAAGQLVKWMTILLVANAVICLVALVSGWLEIDLLERAAYGEITDAVDIPLAIVAMLLVRGIHGMQERSRYTTVFD